MSAEDESGSGLPSGAAKEGESSSEPLPEVLTVEELARLLRLNRKTVYEALARREIPGVRRVGRVIRISRDAVLDWLSGQGRVSRSGGHR